MEDKITRTIGLAQAVSRLTDPTLLAVAMLLLITLTRSPHPRELVGAAATIIFFFVCMPMIYVYLRISYGGHGSRSKTNLTRFLKEHPRDILILACMMGLSCLAILLWLRAPTTLIATVVALLAASIVTALCYLCYKVSFHLTGITVLIVMATRVWGPRCLVLLAAIPVIAWAKFRIHDHTIYQLVLGVTVGTAASLLAIHVFGLHLII